MKEIDVVLKFLSTLGLDFEESQVYLAMVEKGELTVLEISKLKNISRTTVYRIIEKLEKEGLVEETKFKKKRFYKTVGAEKLEILVKAQENKSSFLREVLPELEKVLPSTSYFSQPGTAVTFYKGIKGVQELIWNTLETDKVLRTLAIEDLENFLGRDFTGRWKIEFMLKKLEQRTIYNKENSSKFHFDLKDSKDLKYFNRKSISQFDFEIYMHTHIYNSKVCYIGFHDGEMYGVELENYSLKQMQKQYFDLLWKVAR